MHFSKKNRSLFKDQKTVRGGTSAVNVKITIYFSFLFVSINFILYKI